MFKFLEWLASWFPRIIMWRPPSGIDADMYGRRFYLFGWPGRWLRDWLPFNLYLHHFRLSDDPRPHNHSCAILSLILAGGYIERRVVESSWGPPRMVPDYRVHKPWSFNWIPVKRLHSVDLLDEERGCWTLVFTGPQWGRRWGFLRSDGTIEDSHEVKRGQS